ncbi:MAG: DUF5069 domain-containing protein [Verrucomicrobia bacterium]|nr:DUF5069 domain-containing protein [Verrucomicrobiota bacterium]
MPSLPPTAPGYTYPDLTVRPPRSPRVRLGGFVILPRLLDKARAHLAGKQGEYIFNSGLDKRFFSFVKITPDAFLEQVATGAGDGALLAWIAANSEHQPSDWEIAQWSAFQGEKTPGTLKAREHYAKQHAALAPERTDLATGFDFLDLDDHVTFGGKA